MLLSEQNEHRTIRMAVQERRHLDAVQKGFRNGVVEMEDVEDGEATVALEEAPVVKDGAVAKDEAVAEEVADSV